MLIISTSELDKGSMSLEEGEQEAFYLEAYFSNRVEIHKFTDSEEANTYQKVLNAAGADVQQYHVLRIIWRQPVCWTRGTVD